ncbi:6-bladed beta-propeller [Rhodohalobacter mucosus]|uniref:6-bladed beta-propeller protein n=1 Tax=Rhodohalobacter mucosus TaxID=2079485 RepID=A0A316TS91_9BACT|nr:6-bladed beta-propeller [Rhodohalobacter mucosus]PWN05094.1 hypothetical protein DDZ15_16185 [Rhodohalobacter mucosus]
MNRFLKQLLIILSIPLFISCSSDRDMDSAAEIRTDELPGVGLERLFTIDEPEGQFFEYITAIDTDSEGRIFLVDQRAHRIYVYGRDGQFLTAFGQEGAGPADFRAILRFMIDENDRLIIFDMFNNRTAVYEESGDTWVPESFMTIEGSRFGAEAVDAAGNVIVRQSKNQMPEPGVYWYIHELAPAHLDSGLTGDKRLEFREMNNLVTDELTMRRIPFGRTTLLAAGKDGRYYMAWNDSFNVEVYDMSLNLVDSVRAPVPNQPVTQEERSAALEAAGPQFRSLASTHMPETKPVAASMKVDPAGNFWLHTYDTPEYLVLDNEGNPLGSFDLPGEDEEILHVSSDRMYTVRTGEEGTKITVYEFCL